MQVEAELDEALMEFEAAAAAKQPVKVKVASMDSVASQVFVR